MVNNRHRSRAGTLNPNHPGGTISADTKAALEDALQAHLADECGPSRIATDYVLTSAFINLDRPQADNVTGYFHEVRGAMHSSIGLTELQAEWLASGGGTNDPDDPADL